MTRPRTSLSAMMMAVLIAALGFGALRFGNYQVYRWLYLSTILSFPFALVAARYQGGLRGAFYFGFAAFGGTLFLVGMVPPHEWHTRILKGQGQVGGPDGNPMFPTTDLVVVLARLMTESPDDRERYIESYFSRIGLIHLMMVWGCGGVGGLFAARLASRNARVDPSEKS